MIVSFGRAQLVGTEVYLDRETLEAETELRVFDLTVARKPALDVLLDSFWATAGSSAVVVGSGGNKWRPYFTCFRINGCCVAFSPAN